MTFRHTFQISSGAQGSGTVAVSPRPATVSHLASIWVIWERKQPQECARPVSGGTGTTQGGRHVLWTFPEVLLWEELLAKTLQGTS